MMNLNFPGGGLGRGRVWRAQAWVGDQPNRPWLGTLNPGSAASDGAQWAPSGGGGGTSCPWAGGNALPYIQQQLTFGSAELYCLDDFFDQCQQRSPVTSSPTSADDVLDDVKRHSKSLELPRSLEEDEIERCIGVLDEILDLYDADDNDAEFFPSTQAVVDVTSSHLLPLRSFRSSAARNLEIRKSTTSVQAELTDVKEEPSLENITNQELYARRKQALQLLPPSTVSSSDSAVFLQCNEQSTDGDLTPNIQDDRSNPDSGYLANTDADSDLSAPGSKRSVGSDGSSRLTSLRSSRWLAETGGVSVDDDNADPSSGSTLTNASSSQRSSSSQTVDVDDATNVAGFHSPADAIANFADGDDDDVESVYDELNDAGVDVTIHGEDEYPPTSSTHHYSLLPLPPLTLTSTQPPDFDNDDLLEFPPPPPLMTPAGSSVGPFSTVTSRKLPPPPPLLKTTSTRGSVSEADELSTFPPPPPMMLPAVGSASRSSTITSRKLPPPLPALKLTSTQASDSDVEELPVFPPAPPLRTPSAGSVDPSSTVPAVGTLRKLPPPPPPIKRTSTRASGSEGEELPPPPPMMLPAEGSVSPFFNVAGVATSKRQPPTLPKSYKTSNGSVASCSVVGAFELRTSTSSSPSSTLSSRYSARRSSLPPTPPAPLRPPAAGPPPPPPRPPATADFPPPPTSPTHPVASHTARRASTNSIPPLSPSQQTEFSVDSETESPYSIIPEALRETDEGAGGLAAALKGVKLHAVTDAEKRSPAAGADQKDPMSALVDQLHGGFQLRPTALGHHIRGRDSTPVTSAEATVESIQEDDDEEYANSIEIEQQLSRTPRKPLPPVPVKKSAPLGNTAALHSQAEPSHNIDVTQLPGYQVIAPDCPQWKRVLIEKKNALLLSEAMKEHEAKRQEEERWKDVPEWKRNLIKKKQEH